MSLTMIELEHMRAQIAQAQAFVTFLPRIAEALEAIAESKETSND